MKIFIGCTLVLSLAPGSHGQNASRARTVAPPNAQVSSQTPQTPPAPPQNDDDGGVIIGARIVNVTLPVTVINENGQFVSGLKREDFQVLENRQAQPILSFQKYDKMPLNLSLAMDLSTSIRNRLAFEKEAVKEFLEKLLDNRRDRAALVTFNENVEFRQGFTSDFHRIGQTVGNIKTADGQTALYDAVYKICTEQMPSADTKRRVILLLTDGADTGSRKTLDQAIAIAQKSEVVIYAISTKGGGEFRVEGNPYRNIDDKDLKRLCKETGGDVYFPSNMSQLKRAFEYAEASLRNQYRLVYEPTDSSATGKFHQVEVHIPSKKGLTVLTRSGYFATPQ